MNCVSILCINSSWLALGISVRPTPPRKSTSPPKSTPAAGSKKATWPGVWPGANSTVKRSDPSDNSWPAASQTVGLGPASIGTPHIVAPPLLSYKPASSGCRASGNFGLVRSRPATAPMWSKCACVCQMAVRVQPRAAMRSSNNGASHAASMTTHCAVTVSATTYALVSTGPSGSVSICNGVVIAAHACKRRSQEHTYWLNSGAEEV